MSKNGYEGRIKNSGAQEIKAPNAQKGTKGTVVQRGQDLRSGGKK